MFSSEGSNFRAQDISKIYSCSAHVRGYRDEIKYC